MSGGNWKEMFKAIEEGDLEMVRYYLKIGVNPNYQHPEFLASPLIESIRNNNLDIARLILENDGDPEIKEVWGGDTPLSVAKAKNNQAAVDLLMTYLKKV